MIEDKKKYSKHSNISITKLQHIKKLFSRLKAAFIPKSNSLCYGKYKEKKNYLVDETIIYTSITISKLLTIAVY